MFFATCYEQLKPAERAFVDGYIDGLDAEAVRTGERLSNVLMARQPSQAEIARSRGMLERQHVVAAIRERAEEITRNREIAPARVLNEFEALAFSNMKHYIRVAEDGWIDWDFSRVTDEQWKAVKTFKVEDVPGRGRKFEMQLHDKVGPLDKFLRYMGLTDDDNPHWRAERARRLPATQVIDLAASDAQASDAYSRMLESVG